MAMKDWFTKKDEPASANSSARILSLLKPEIAFKHGLTNPAIAGIFRSSDPNDTSPENFAPNKPFIETLHRIVQNQGPTTPSFADAARQQGKGSLCIIDRRTPVGSKGKVLSEDIVGAFAVTDGVASSATYHPNPNYRIYTRNGLTRLPEPLHAFLIEELERLSNR